MKRILLGCLVMLTLTLCACGNEGTKEHIKTGEEIAVEQAIKAQDAVEENNEAVKELENQAQQIDELEE